MKCRICDHNELKEVINLGEQPWGNNFLSPEEAGKEPFYPLNVVHCSNCRCAQLAYTVPKETMFSDHTYVSGSTSTLREHFRETALYVNEHFFPETNSKSVLDIGSNDGTQLLQYKDLGFDVLGVESSAKVAQMAVDQNVPTVQNFFNLECAREIDRKFHVINASGIFFHLEELHSATDAVRMCLREDGVFVVHFLYMKTIMENVAFDQIYHEHLLYYTLKTITSLLKRHELEPFDAYWSPIHGGSIILFANHEGRQPVSERLLALRREEDEAGTNELEAYQQLSNNIEITRARNLNFLDAAKADGKRIYGMGAPVKGNTLLNTFKIGTNYLDCLAEINPLRKGLVSPGMHIPIIMEDEIKAPPDVYFVLAWNFRKEILAKNADLIKKGVQFWFPIEPKADRDTGA